MPVATLVTFLIYLIGLMILGIIAYRQTHNLADYVLGGRQLGSSCRADKAKPSSAAWNPCITVNDRNSIRRMKLLLMRFIRACFINMLIKPYY